MRVPSGGIVIWSGAIVDIPNGFVLCDGNNGTPDLRNRFIVGAGDTYAVNASGGSSSHTHAFTSNGHNHNLVAGSLVASGGDFDSATTTETDSGITDPANHLPPYFSLAYIMKT